MDRRRFLQYGGAAASAALLARAATASAQGAVTPAPPIAPAANAKPAGAAKAAPFPGGQPAVITPNGSTLPWKLVDGVKVGHLIASAVDHEFAPGLRAQCWGYNGTTPGPTIEAVEGDRLRIYVTNHLPEPTTVHWHGLIVANGMDGVAGLTQKPIPVGETFVYELTLKQAGTFMYHPHFDEMTQIALGMSGMFVVHPKKPRGPRVDRDFALLTHEWRLDVGASRPDPMEMTDFNVLTLNSKAFPGTAPLMMGKGERVRIRFGNLSPMDHHPLHFHGVNFTVTQTDGGYVPASAQVPETTVLVPVGSVRVIELVPDEPGDWAMHCHMTHHIMTQMGHGLPPLIGANTQRLDQQMRSILPGYMTMGQRGMGNMGAMNMPVPENSLPMRGAMGPFSYIDMGGMFTILKVREDVETADPNGYYVHPEGTVAGLADGARLRADGIVVPPAPQPSGPADPQPHDHSQHGQGHEHGAVPWKK